MSTRTEPWPAGTPCYADLFVPDVAGAAAFYADVVGWTFVDTGGYLLAQVDGRTAAGIGSFGPEGEPAGWTVYLASDDVDATAALVGEHGGHVLDGPRDVPGSGRLFIGADPTGGVFGVWQHAGAVGSEVQDEPGAFVWDDARLRDVEAGKRFYADVFGLRYAPLFDGVTEYETFSTDGERPVGGIGASPPGAPSHWLAYFTVADVDAAVEAVGDGGGRVLMTPEATPFGRIGVVADAWGAVFGLHQAA